MAANYITTAGTNFPPELVAEMFNKVKGHSSLAKLSGMTPIPFNGIAEFVFSMDGEAQLVGESGKKDKNEAKAEPVVIRPVKFIYQHRVSDEFVRQAESRLNYLRAFADGFAAKIARALDIAAFHGLDPYSMTAASGLAENNFDGLVTNLITYAAATADQNIDAAVAAIQAEEGDVNGIAMSPAFSAAMAAIKVNGVAQYPEFRFGQNPGSFYGMGADVNTTVTAKASGATRTDHAIIGDFKNAFRWGYAANIPLEVIQYGDPDQTGRDLKAYNEVCLRSEAYIGWGILDKDSFAIVKAE